MTNILVLNGSPKKHSTTLAMTKEFLRGFSQVRDSQIQYVSSYEKHIKYCQSDLSCWLRQDGRCVIQDDDMNDILAAMQKSDCLIWSFPLHCHGIPASLKAIIDRTIAFLNLDMIDCGSHIEHARNFDISAKKNVFIIGGGYPYYPGNFAAVKSLLQTYFKTPVMLCICETAILDADAPELKPLKTKLFSRLFDAGAEYGKQGRLSDETIGSVEAPLMPNDAYIAMINRAAQKK